MLKKRLGIEAIELDWKRKRKYTDHIYDFYKIPSTLIIPENCIRIGEEAFSCCYRKLRKVIIPKSVKIIGDCSFYHCLTATIILQKPKKEFRYFGDFAFEGCSKVKVIL